MKHILAAALALCSIAFASSQAKDGTYWAESQSRYAQEPYWGNAFVEIVDGKLSGFGFYIIDRQSKDVFDQNYERHYLGNDYYVSQCRKDWAGLQAYIERFCETKDLDKVDAISGATWSYNIFKDTTAAAIKKAAQK